MGLYEYMMLSEDDQWNELWENGQYITCLRFNGQKHVLYALHRFFVEVRLDSDTDQILEKVHFKQGRLLDKYSREIRI